MRVHLWHWHVWDTMVILQEGNLPHPQCSLCNMLVPWRSLNGSHKHTSQCMPGAEPNQWSLAVEEERAVKSRAFSTYGSTLVMVPPFNYLGRVLLAVDDYWPAMIRILKKSRAVWKGMTRILIREGERPRVYGFFFKAVVQLVLLFVAEMRVVTPRTRRVLGGFQDQVKRRLMGRLQRRRL